MKSRQRQAALAGSIAALVVLGGLMAAPAQASEANPTTQNSVSEDSQYLLEFNGEVVTLDEGESALFPMNSIPSTTMSGEASPGVAYPGDCGVIEVTAAAGQYHYGVAMTCPANEFLGSFSITDLTSGLGGGSATATGFSGTVTTSKLKGHRYSGTLTGAAYLLGVQISTTGPNNTIYNYIDY